MTDDQRTDTEIMLTATVPALYIGESDYVLTVSDEHEYADTFDITASRGAYADGRPKLIIIGHGFRPPAGGGNDPRDDMDRLIDTFGGFLGHYCESTERPSGWTIYDNGEDLNALADACAMHAESVS